MGNKKTAQTTGLQVLKIGVKKFVYVSDFSYLYSIISAFLC